MTLALWIPVWVARVRLIEIPPSPGVLQGSDFVRVDEAPPGVASPASHLPASQSGQRNPLHRLPKSEVWAMPAIPDRPVHSVHRTRLSGDNRWPSTDEKDSRPGRAMACYSPATLPPRVTGHVWVTTGGPATDRWRSGLPSSLWQTQTLET